MEAVAKEPGVAKKTGIPQSVGKEFASADESKMRAGKKLGPSAATKKRSPAELHALAGAFSKMGKR